MQENLDELSDEEKLKAENEFLKMKMMLEHGAQFGSGDTPLPAAMENEFLNYILAFEKQAANPKYIKLYDKIMRPTHFIPVDEISDDEIETAWEELCAYMHEYCVSIDVFSPNVSVRELYRFVTEELFDHDVNDIKIPGLKSQFIYDEFYPDPYYDNTVAAVNDCIKCILQKQPMEWLPYLRNENLQLNNQSSLTEEEFKKLVNRFKAAYDEFEIIELNDTSCTVDGNKSRVTGTYVVNAALGIETLVLAGNWCVDFERDEDLGYWYIYSVTIDGINF